MGPTLVVKREHGDTRERVSGLTFLTEGLGTASTRGAYSGPPIKRPGKTPEVKIKADAKFARSAADVGAGSLVNPKGGVDLRYTLNPGTTTFKIEEKVLAKFTYNKANSDECCKNYKEECETNCDDPSWSSCPNAACDCSLCA